MTVSEPAIGVNSMHTHAAHRVRLRACAIVAGALMVSIFLLWPFAPENADENMVARANVPLIELPQPIPNLRPEPVSLQVQKPVRVTDTSAQAHDLSGLVKRVLVHHGYDLKPDDRFYALLLQTLAEQQTDAYIDVMLDSALKQGEIDPPPDLIARDGSVDTDVLLASFLELADS